MDTYKVGYFIGSLSTTSINRLLSKARALRSSRECASTLRTEQRSAENSPRSTDSVDIGIVALRFVEPYLIRFCWTAPARRE